VCDGGILIVDDEPEFVASLVELLEDEGYPVRTAVTGKKRWRSWEAAVAPASSSSISACPS